MSKSKINNLKPESYFSSKSCVRLITRGIQVFCLKKSVIKPNDINTRLQGQYSDKTPSYSTTLNGPNFLKKVRPKIMIPVEVAWSLLQLFL